MPQLEHEMREKFGPEFVDYLEELELFEAHVKYLKNYVDEEDLMWLVRFGRVGLSESVEE